MAVKDGSAMAVAGWADGDRSPGRAGGNVPARGWPSTAAIAGHPIHPMLVPFPIAFLTAALATDLAARRTQDPFWSRASRWLLGAGAVSGLTAGAFGAMDYFTIRHAQEQPTGRLHAYGNVTALTLAAANIALRRNAPDGAAPRTGEVLLSAATAAILGVTGWAGGELSYRYRIGVTGDDDPHADEAKRLAP